MGPSRAGIWAQRGLTAALATLAVALLPGSAAAAPACSDEFTGPSGGSWAVSANWSSSLPGGSTVACWDAAKTVVVDEGAQSVEAIAHGGALVVAGHARLVVAGAGPDASALGSLQTGEAGALELHGTLSCATAAVGGGELLVDGSIECPVAVTGGGKLRGVGSTAAVLNEAGVVEPGDGTTPGGLTVASYRQGPAGTLSAREDAAGAGRSDHLLRALGPVSLDGTISLSPGSAPTGFQVLAAPSAPDGYFAHVVAPPAGSPWTVAYGAEGAAAVSGGSVPAVPLLSGPALPGGTLTCGLGGTGAGAPAWQPRGPAAYSWGGPFAPVGETQPRAVPELLAEQLDAELDADRGQTFTVPGSAVGRAITCAAIVWTPAGGSRPSVVATGESSRVMIGGPYRLIRPPTITGKPAPGSKLMCSHGQWQGSPDSYTYEWFTGASPAGSDAATYGVRETDEPVARDPSGETERRLTCVVTAHYGPTAVPGEASVRVSARPQPTECPRRPLTLVSARTVPGSVLLFGAGVQRLFGDRVLALRRSGPHGAWRRVASGRVNSSGYFELRVPYRRAMRAAGTYRVTVGRTLSNPVPIPGLLQIVSDGSRRGESLVDLRLSAAARSGARVTVSRLAECEPGPVIAAARLRPGAVLSVRLTAQRGTGPGYYLARTIVGGRAESVELVVPELPEIRRLLG